MFNRAEMHARASRNLISRAPTPLSETIGTTFDVAQDQTSVAIRDAQREHYQAWAAEIEQATGVRLRDPFEALTEMDRRRLGQPDDDEMQSGRDLAIDRFHRQAEALRERHPDMPFRTRQDILDEIAADREATRERRAHAALGERGTLSTAAGFLGSVGGAMWDPLILGTLPFGASWSRGILRAALIEAGIGVASETAVQATFQQQRQLVGEEADLREALANIAMVGAGAGILGGAMAGAARGVRSLRARRANLEQAEGLSNRSADLEAAIAVERRSLETAEASPLPDTAAGRALHETRMREAMTALAEGRATFHVGRADVTPQDVAAMRAVRGLDERELDAIRTAAGRAESFEAWTDFVRELQSPPQPESRRLLTVLREEGGIRDEAGELAHMGITSRTRPGLIRKGGRDFDSVGERLQELGFFPHRPTVREVLDLIRADHTAGPIHADAGAMAVREHAEALTELASALQDAGVNVTAARSTAALEATREAVQRLARGADAIERVAREADIPPPRANEADAMTADANARADEAMAGDIDQLREQRVASLPDDATVVIETPDGFRTITARQLREIEAREAADFEAIQICNGRA